MPASSLVIPRAIASQNRCRFSRRHTGGRPGERIAGRPVCAAIHPGGRPITHLHIEVLRPPVESAQYTSIAVTERLAAIGVSPSIGTVGDAYDNALAETVVGLYKTELINPNKPWKTVEEVEIATLRYVDWFNNTRLYEENGDIPPVELEQAYYRQHRHSA
jgi:transposase InsO family protein